MISIIICSTSPVTNPELVSNISKTIGSEYEIVHVDNSKGKYGICAAYNIGVARAKGDILCFMHEDVKFHSSEWGKRVEYYFANNDIGMLGVAGGRLVPERSDWRFIDLDYLVIRLIQGITSPTGFHFVKPQDWEPTGQLHQVAILDGVWFCIHRDLFTSIRFDQETFPYFHLYDSDISMQVNRLGKKLYVCDDVILEHFSEGTFSESFSTGLDDFLGKWESELPLVRGIETPLTDEVMETQACIAESHLIGRLKSDITMIEYRKREADGTLGLMESEKLKVVWRREYIYIKKAIKFSVPLGQVWKLIMSYPWKYRKFKLKLMYKLIYYRIIR